MTNLALVVVSSAFDSASLDDAVQTLRQQRRLTLFQSRRGGQDFLFALFANE